MTGEYETGYFGGNITHVDGKPAGEITTTNPADQFRAKAQDVLIGSANMTLHQLVDEFQRLQDVIDKNMVTEAGGDYPTMNETAQLAFREQKIVAGTARARFGIAFEAYDRTGTANAAW